MLHRVHISTPSLRSRLWGVSAKQPLAEEEQQEENWMDQERQKMDIRQVEICTLVWGVQIWDFWFHYVLSEAEKVSRWFFISCGSQDIDPKHTSRPCTGCLTKQESDRALCQMTCPPESPHLKPKLRGFLAHRLKGKAANKCPLLYCTSSVVRVTSFIGQRGHHLASVSSYVHFLTSKMITNLSITSQSGSLFIDFWLRAPLCQTEAQTFSSTCKGAETRFRDGSNWRLLSGD